MNIAFRTDASTLIGAGHIMRCLTLANVLRSEGHHVLFVCRKYPGSLNHVILKNKYELKELCFDDAELYQKQIYSDKYSQWLWVSQQQDADETAFFLQSMQVDLLIIDHYSLDSVWEKHMRTLCKKIMVIDDLANRNHDCDLLLDQNLQLQSDRYKNLVPASCELLLGTKYVLLRSEFLKIKQRSNNKNLLQNIFVFFGGGDSVNIIQMVLRGIIESKFSGIVNVVLGKNNSRSMAIEKNFDRHKFIYFYQEVENIVELMKQADLCIGAGGTNSWERCFLGLPSLIITVAENQLSVANALAAMNAAQYLGELKKVSTKLITSSINALILNPQKLKKLSENAKNLVDGGGTKRASKKIMAEIYLKKATPDDVKSIFHLRNHPAIRKNSFSSEEIIFDEHKTWFNSLLKNASRQLLIAKNFKKELIGVVRFDFEKDFAEVSIYINPGVHGKGYGTKILAQGIEWVMKNYHCRHIIAKVKSANIVSQKLFLKAGFINKTTHFEKIINN